ncbi:hypothetical protein [Clostridium sp. UBA2485]|nr:hypothetical protein [Clostridium sp. UBA2485]
MIPSVIDIDEENKKWGCFVKFTKADSYIYSGLLIEIDGTI